MEFLPWLAVFVFLILYISLAYLVVDISSHLLAELKKIRKYHFTDVSNKDLDFVINRISYRNKVEVEDIKRILASHHFWKLSDENIQTLNKSITPEMGESVVKSILADLEEEGIVEDPDLESLYTKETKNIAGIGRALKPFKVPETLEGISSFVKSYIAWKNEKGFIFDPEMIYGEADMEKFLEAVLGLSDLSGKYDVEVEKVDEDKYRINLEGKENFYRDTIKHPSKYILPKSLELLDKVLREKVDERIWYDGWGEVLVLSRKVEEKIPIFPETLKKVQTD